MEQSGLTFAAPMSEPARPQPESAEIVFVGGTGRSGTHIIGSLLGRHPRYANLPNEARFHCDPGGIPDLLAGQTDRAAFERRMRRQWYRRLQIQRMRFRGLHRHVDRSTFRAGMERFSERFDVDPDGACAGLFLDLLWPIVERADKEALVEQSCDTIAAAPTLLRLFPEAKFIHIVRDGRDAAASRIAQGKKITGPRNMDEALDWWEGRLRRIDDSIRQIPEERLVTIGLEDLVVLRRKRNYQRIRRLLGVKDQPRMRNFFRREMRPGNVHRGKWAGDLDQSERDRINARYEEILDGLAADGVQGKGILRRAYETPYER